jgi:hypothetical protein
MLFIGLDLSGPTNSVETALVAFKLFKRGFLSLYFDANGDIWYQGEFQYTGDSSFDTGDNLSYTGWDGDFLYLANGEKLIAVDATQLDKDGKAASSPK